MCAPARRLPVEHTSAGRSLSADTVDLAPRELAAAVATSGLSPVESGAELESDPPIAPPTTTL